MSAWKDSDEVTTTYGSIQLSLQQAHAAGIKTERERIIKLLEEYEVIGVDSKTRLMLNEDALIALIKGETK